MERARKRTPIFQRSKGACIAGLAVSLCCAIFGVGGAAAGDGTYARQAREAQVQARLAGASLAHRTPEQLVLAITPKSQHAPSAASTPAATTAASPSASTTLTDTAAQTVPTGTTLTDTTPQPGAVTPTTAATSNPGASASAGPGDSTSTGNTGTTPADNTTTGTTGTDNSGNTGTDNSGTDNGGNGNGGNGDNGNGNGKGDNGNGNGDNGNGNGGNGRPDTSGATGTGTTTTSSGHGRSAAVGGTTSGSTTNTCHGRCTGSSQGGGVLPASLPSSNSQVNAGNFSLSVTPGATTTPAPTPSTPVNAVSGVTLPPTASATPPASTSNGSSTKATKLGKFPTFRSTSGVHNLSHGRTGSTHTAPLRTAGSGAVALASATTRPARTAGTRVAAAPAATTGPSKTASGTHKPRKNPSSGGAGPAGPIIQVVDKFVKVIPTAVWIALGAAFGLALAFAAIALRAGRRARRREREFKAISAAAATDALTGILNRRGFMDAAERELARASRYDRPFVVAYVDVRGLKAVNDTEGHLVGDELIKAVAGLMKESARADDVVGRIGGDEFALLLDEQTAEGAQPVLRRIRSRVEEHRAAMEIRVPWELTIGIAAFPADGTTLEELLGAADRRLYEQRGIALR